MIQQDRIKATLTSNHNGDVIILSFTRENGKPILLNEFIDVLNDYMDVLQQPTEGELQ
jgi:hypothetical protein